MRCYCATIRSGRLQEFQVSGSRSFNAPQEVRESTVRVALHESVARLADARANRGPVLVWGDYMVDRYVEGECERISPEAPVPVVRATREWSTLGGAGNVAGNLRGMGIDAIPVGIVGEDGAGDELTSLLEEAGCSTGGILAGQRRTTVKTRVIARQQQVVRIDREECDALNNQQVERLRLALLALLSSSELCVISDYGKGACPPCLVKELISKAKERKIPVLVDPGRDISIYEGATCIKPNLKEAESILACELSEQAHLAAAGVKLRRALNVDHLLVTQGPGGMTLVSSSGVHRIRASARQVFDVSGAGDTVIATLAASVVAGLDYGSGAMLANMAAGIAVGRVGTCVVTLDDLIAGVSHYEGTE